MPLGVGGKVQAGLFGGTPPLEKLHRGDLSFTRDFRSVYATVLKHWLATDADRILGRRVRTVPLVKT